MRNCISAHLRIGVLWLVISPNRPKMIPQGPSYSDAPWRAAHVVMPRNEPSTIWLVLSTSRTTRKRDAQQVEWRQSYSVTAGVAQPAAAAAESGSAHGRVCLCGDPPSADLALGGSACRGGTLLDGTGSSVGSSKWWFHSDRRLRLRMPLRDSYIFRHEDMPKSSRDNCFFISFWEPSFQAITITSTTTTTTTKIESLITESIQKGRIRKLPALTRHAHRIKPRAPNTSNTLQFKMAMDDLPPPPPMPRTYVLWRVRGPTRWIYLDEANCLLLEFCFDIGRPGDSVKVDDPNFSEPLNAYPHQMYAMGKEEISYIIARDP